MKLKFLICATAAIVDQQTKNVSITNVLEQLTSPVFPAAIPITVVAHFIRAPTEPDAANIRVLFKIDGTILMDSPVTIDFQGQLTTRLIAQVNPMVIPQQGTLITEVRAKGQSLGTWSIDVKKGGDEMLLMNTPSAPVTANGTKNKKATAKRAAVKKAAARKATKKRA